MGLTGELFRGEISDFERDKRVPPPPVLLAYARVAGVYIDALFDDDVDLSANLPCSPNHEGLRRKANKTSRKS
jgi:hypothetical protein